MDEDLPSVVKLMRVCVCGHGGMSHPGGGKCQAVEVLPVYPPVYERCACEREVFA